MSFESKAEFSQVFCKQDHRNLHTAFSRSTTSKQFFFYVNILIYHDTYFVSALLHWELIKIHFWRNNKKLLLKFFPVVNRVRNV